ncbi:MAG TPA: ATP-binding protein [Opitutaceae bacterium]|nr:ATP-binding protein [Opitutaceae bacterium]
MKSAPEGVVETGAPAFVVLGAEALGLSSAPVDFKILPDHRILVVSQRELAFGDGVRWDTFRTGEDEPPVYSSVAVDDDGNIYTGTESGISLVELGEGRRWRLKPSLHLPELAATQNSTLVSVATLPEEWYWYGGNGSIVRWRPGREPRSVGNLGAIERIFTLDGVNFVSDESSGALYRMTDDGVVEPIRAAEVLVSEVVTCAVPFAPGELLVGTGASGLKIFDGSSFRPFGLHELPGRGQRITDLVAIGDSYFAVSIDTLGIIFLDRKGRIVQAVERSLDHRLARVRKLLYSKSGVLWALLNDGIARLEFPSPLSNFDPLMPGGIKYAQPVRHNGTLWLLADGRALRGTTDGNGRLERFEGDTPPGRYLFTLNETDGQLFACSEIGIYIRGEAGWELILPGIVNARVGVARPVGDGVFYVARGEYGVIRHNGNEHVATRILMPELGDSYGVAIDADGIGWLEYGTSKVARFDPREGNPALEMFGAADGLDMAGWVEIYTLEGTARFHIQNQLYRFDIGTGKFVHDVDLLARLPHLAATVGRPVTDGMGRLWHTVDGAIRVIDLSRPSVANAISIPPVGFAPTSYTAEDNDVIWMYVRGRLSRMDLRVPVPPTMPLAAQITSVEFTSSSRQLFRPGNALEALDYADNSMVFHYAAPANPFAGPVTFEVLLEGAGDTWASTGAVGSTAFRRLKEGKYVFRVRPVRSGGIYGAEASVAFTILPPWFRTTAAWVAYTCIALSVLGFVMWLSSFLQRRENERLELLVAQRTSELSASNDHLGRQIEETTVKTVALSASEERYRELNAELEVRVRQRTSELEEAHQQLVSASRKAGMAEVATGVLHNVGNVLNSVNVSATLVRATLRTSEISTLERVASLIRENFANIADYLSNDPKGRHIPEFLMRLTSQLSKEHAVLQTENEQLARNVEHIKGIVAMQQNYATTSGVMEEVSPSHLVRDAIQMHAGSLQRHGIEVSIGGADLPPVTLDKHKVLQILVNLIQNAKHAVRESGRTDGRIEVAIAVGEDDRIKISVSDNGVGIPEENLVRIFSHGFTTRAKGHGFGLHSGANAAREMGGSLRAESVGPGMGATFTLDVPVGVARAMA